jgi:hypothetical protein
MLKLTIPANKLFDRIFIKFFLPKVMRCLERVKKRSSCRHMPKHSQMLETKKKPPEPNPAY